MQIGSPLLQPFQKSNRYGLCQSSVVPWEELGEHIKLLLWDSSCYFVHAEHFSFIIKPFRCTRQVH
uniref:Uncharacterized protein n=1 Tax=Rhizophora mucronata TaxID=61149 RepID=A0A2P2QAL0_RHIMU